MADSKQTEQPPAYATSQYPPGAYPPPQQGGYPPQQQGGYPPPQPPPQGYAPPPQGYAPPPQGYAPPPQMYAPQPQMYAPQPQMMSQQSSTNVVVVGGQQPGQTVIIEKKGVNHCMHCCISIFFPPWIIVWICLCICD